ncbi:PcfK-like family protein [Polaribacter aestuariivivens]|uniref:PcfK-like family protein n=1 Tax=Polaribacter aestuariivivens TaxID=2304626 RepID=UPI003F490B58
MKTTNNFKKVIQNHLEQLAIKDELFAETFKKKNKNIDDCITYILNQVKASGCSGFADDEIFGMAIHYYDEDDIKPGSKISGKVVVNHSVELSETDIKKAKQQALDKVIQEEKERIRAKKKPTKSKEVVSQTPTLF